MSAPVQDLLKTTEAAEYLRLHPGHLNNLRSRSKGPAYIKLGFAVRYRRCDLDRWIEEHAVCGDPVGDE
jgi:hypothetical protein